MLCGPHSSETIPAMNLMRLHRGTALGTRARWGAAALALAALLPALAQTTPSASAATAGTAAPRAASGSLSVTPAVFVAGQALRFRGSIDRAGVRAVHLQSHMNRAGDTWRDVPASSFRTDARGIFDFIFTGPAMFNISYRVVGGGLASPAHLFNPRPQEVTLTLAGGTADSPYHSVAPGLPFTVVADTAPAVWTTHGAPPAIPGRTVLLQERDRNQWRTIDT